MVFLDLFFIWGARDTLHLGLFLSLVGSQDEGCCGSFFKNAAFFLDPWGLFHKGSCRELLQVGGVGWAHVSL